MANQDPQPELYTTRHSFTGATAVAGDTSVQTVFTNQANNEEVRIYGIQVHLITTAGGNDTALVANDMKLSIQVGNAKIPSQEFDVGVIHQKDDKMLTFFEIQASILMLNEKVHQEKLNMYMAYLSSEHDDTKPPNMYR